MLDSLRAERLAKRIREYLEKDHGKLILDLENVRASEGKALDTLANKLRAYRRRIRIRLPRNYLDRVDFGLVDETSVALRALASGHFKALPRL